MGRGRIAPPHAHVCALGEIETIFSGCLQCRPGGTILLRPMGEGKALSWGYGSRDRVARLRATGVVVAAIVVWCLVAAGSASAVGCPNEARRLEQGSGFLPGCRAYEMVTPTVKGSGEPEPIDPGEAKEGRDLAPYQISSLPPANGARAALDGDRMAWISEPLPGARAPGIDQLATRGSDGWLSEDLVPPMSPLNDLLCPVLMGASGWSTDLSRAVLDLPAGAPRGFRGEEECGNDEPRLVAGEPEHFRNLFVRDNLSGSQQLVNVTPAGATWPEPEESLQRLWPASFLAASDDLGKVVFEEELALTPDAPVGYRGGDELYEWSGGQVRLVTVLPGGTPVHGSLAGATRNYAAESEPAGVFEKAANVAQFRHAVSADGSRVFFEAVGGLYIREDGARTVQVDASHGSGADGGGHFMVASADGSRVLFSDENQLTPDSTAGLGEPDLYQYDIGSGHLADLTAHSGEAASVLGVSGASEDGSYVYFVARGALDAAPNSQGQTAVPGEPNLYVAHGGGNRFIATLDPAADECDWTAAARCGGGLDASGLTTRVSANGDFAGFNSIRSLTGYDNTDSRTGEPDLEIFLYEAGPDRLVCASCNPLGTQPTQGAAIHWPANPGKNANWDNTYPQHNVSDNGQVFFETADALQPADHNGRRDVYQYAAGALSLISTGTAEASSHFLDATPDGSDVFFSTAQRLLPRDTDTLYDYYDARVDGGFAEPPAPPAPCGGSSCHAGASVEAAIPAAGSSSFVGPGNRKPRHRRCRPARPAPAHGKRAQRRGHKPAKRCRRHHDRKRHHRKRAGK